MLPATVTETPPSVAVPDGTYDLAIIEQCRSNATVNSNSRADS